MRLARFSAALILICQPLWAGPTLVLAIGGEPERGLDPTLGWAELGPPLVQSTLLRRDASGGSRPDLAQSLDLSADGLRWQITLVDGYRFSDGTPVRAEDVAYSFTATKAGANGRDLSVLDRVEVLDDRRLILHLSRPWLTFTEHFHSLGIVPKAHHGAGYGRAPIGSGPWVLRSWRQGEQMIFEPNPHYSGGASDFDRLVLLFAGPEAGLAAARAGQAHVVALPAVAGQLQVDGYHQEDLASFDARGISLPSHGVLADPALRRAMAMAVDRQQLVEAALFGLGRPIAALGDGQPWSRLTPPVPDPQGAAQLLDQAGWSRGGDGIRIKEGQRAAFRVNYPASDPVRQALAEVLSLQLRDLGLDMRPFGTSWPQIEGVMAHEPVVFGFGSFGAEGLYDLLASERAGSGYRNPTHYQNPQVDELMQAAQSAPDRAAADDLWAQAEGLADGDQPWLWLSSLTHRYLVHDCLQIGAQPVQPHGHGWPLLATLDQWRWTCP